MSLYYAQLTMLAATDINCERTNGAFPHGASGPVRQVENKIKLATQYKIINCN